MRRTHFTQCWVPARVQVFAASGHQRRYENCKAKQAPEMTRCMASIARIWDTIESRVRRELSLGGEAISGSQDGAAITDRINLRLGEGGIVAVRDELVVTDGGALIREGKHEGADRRRHSHRASESQHGRLSPKVSVIGRT